MKPGILVKIYILCACTLDVGVSSLDPLFKPSTLLYCLCSCIPLRFRLWQFNSFGPDTPSYWKAVYDLHVISSKCCHHLSLFTQLSDPVTFTDKHCPGKHSDAKSLSQDYDTPIHHPTLFMISFWSVLSSASKATAVLQLWGENSYMNHHTSWTITTVGALWLESSLLFHCEWVTRSIYYTLSITNTMKLQLYLKVLNINSHLTEFITIHHSMLKSIH